MGVDWIKMQTDLYRHPKVCVMADLLLAPGGALADLFAPLDGVTNGDVTPRHPLRHADVTQRNAAVTRNAVVGALVSVWGVLRHRGTRSDDDLLVPGCTLEVIDAIASLPGLGDAMARVGWATQSPEGLTLPRFFSANNSDPSGPSRSSGAERQRRYRERLRGISAGESVTSPVTSPVTSRNALEKRREEKSIRGMNPPLTPSCPETEKPSPGPAKSPLDPNPARHHPEPAPPPEPSLLEFPCDGAVKTWHLTQAILDQLKFAHPSLDVLGECRKALLWVSADAGRKKTAKGMLRFLAGWMSRAQDRGAGRTGGTSPPHPRESRRDIINRLFADDHTNGASK